MRNEGCVCDDQDQPLLQFPDTGLRKTGKSTPTIFKHSILFPLPKGNCCINREIILRNDPPHVGCEPKISICYPQHWMNFHHPPHTQEHSWDQGLRSIPGMGCSWGAELGWVYCYSQERQPNLLNAGPVPDWLEEKLNFNFTFLAVLPFIAEQGFKRKVLSPEAEQISSQSSCEMLSKE